MGVVVFYDLGDIEANFVYVSPPCLRSCAYPFSSLSYDVFHCILLAMLCCHCALVISLDLCQRFEIHDHDLSLHSPCAGFDAQVSKLLSLMYPGFTCEEALC